MYIGDEKMNWIFILNAFDMKIWHFSSYESIDEMLSLGKKN